MMKAVVIEYGTGDILKADAQALVNPVNTRGVMGKGLALQFKEAFPYNYRMYSHEYSKKTLNLGKVFITFQPHLSVFSDEAGSTQYQKYPAIINFPTKDDWRKPSQLSWIMDGLLDMSRRIHELGITSVAIPALGCGLGGLAWPDVERAIRLVLKNRREHSALHVLLFPPQSTQG